MRLGEQKSFVWAVTPDSVKSFELPGRAADRAGSEAFLSVVDGTWASVPNETLAQRKQRLDHAERIIRKWQRI